MTKSNLSKKRNLISFRSKIQKVIGPDGKTQTIPAQTVIIALMKPQRGFESAMKEITPHIRVIGDAERPRRGNNAIHEGYRVGMEIEKEIYKFEVPLERRFDMLSQITRATHFGWREAALAVCPNANAQELVNKFWEITARDTAKGYLRRIDLKKPLPRQVAESMVWNSVNMGEDAKLVLGKDEKEAFVHHDGCPWYE